MVTVAVFGASGFVGTSILKELARRHVNVFAFSRSDVSNRNKSAFKNSASSPNITSPGSPSQTNMSKMDSGNKAAPGPEVTSPWTGNKNKNKNPNEAGSPPVKTSVGNNGKNEDAEMKVSNVNGESLVWKQADAFDPKSYEEVLKHCDAVVISIGSPPLPTMSEEAYAQKVKENGDSNAIVIKTCEKVGVRQVVLISATMPRWVSGAYLEGKQVAKEAAMHFKKAHADNGASVLCPSAMYGTRYVGGIPVPLTPFMIGPSYGMRAANALGIKSMLEKAAPKVFEGALEAPIHVNNVARAACDCALNKEYKGKMTEITNQDLFKF